MIIFYFNNPSNNCCWMLCDSCSGMYGDGNSQHIDKSLWLWLLHAAAHCRPDVVRYLHHRPTFQERRGVGAATGAGTSLSVLHPNDNCLDFSAFVSFCCSSCLLNLFLCNIVAAASNEICNQYFVMPLLLVGGGIKQ